MVTYLVASGAARLQCLRVVAAAENLSVAEKVDEIDEEFAAHGADKARGVPRHVGAGAGREHTHVACFDRLFALEQAETWFKTMCNKKTCFAA
jgi:hypothetical protein